MLFEYVIMMNAITKTKTSGELGISPEKKCVEIAKTERDPLVFLYFSPRSIGDLRATRARHLAVSEDFIIFVIVELVFFRMRWRWRGEVLLLMWLGAASVPVRQEILRKKWKSLTTKYNGNGSKNRNRKKIMEMDQKWKSIENNMGNGLK